MIQGVAHGANDAKFATCWVGTWDVDNRAKFPENGAPYTGDEYGAKIGRPSDVFWTWIAVAYNGIPKAMPRLPHIVAISNNCNKNNITFSRII